MRKYLKTVAGCLLLVPVGALAQGFGTLSHKTITINRLLPATINLKGKKVRVESRLEGGVDNADDLPSLLKTRLVTFIQKDSRIRIQEPANTILRVTITNYYLEEWDLTNSRTGQTGKAWRGKIEVAYQVVEAGTDKPLVSENLVGTAGLDPEGDRDRSVGGVLRLSGSRSASNATAQGSPRETRDQLVAQIVFAMGKRVVPTEEPFIAYLPGKKLEPQASLAGRWGKLEEEADRLEKFPKADDDTYRVYLVALAKEAQAYELAKEANERDLGHRPDISKEESAKAFERAQRYTDEAGKLYDDICRANTKEKKFRAGSARSEEAIAIYAKVKARMENEGRGDPVVSGPSQPSPSTEPPAAKDGPIAQVLEFCKQGLDPKSIAEYIGSQEFLDDAHKSGTRFVFAKDAPALRDACKANAPVFQTMIRNRLSAPPAAAVPAAPVAPPPATRQGIRKDR